jgi:hypothetical protein
MPVDFKNNIGTYHKKNAIVFSRSGLFPDLVFADDKKLQKIGTCYVELGEQRSTGEIVDFLKSRTRKMNLTIPGNL